MPFTVLHTTSQLVEVRSLTVSELLSHCVAHNIP